MVSKRVPAGLASAVVPLRVAQHWLSIRLGLKRFVAFEEGPKDASPFRRYADLLDRVDQTDQVALDRAHSALIFGMIVACKPSRICELGLGSGFLTHSILHALEFNGTGKLTNVDSWFDTAGVAPPVARQFAQAGVDMVTSDEKSFVFGQPSDSFDLLISDADHYGSASWLDQHIRITKPSGVMFFHDTNNEAQFPALFGLPDQLRERKIPFFHFRKSSRPDERCDRGMIMAFNEKAGLHAG